MRMRIPGGVVTILAGGLLLAGGCLTTLQQGVDLLLSPDAIDNALRLPASGLSGLIERLLRFLGRA